MNDLEMIGFVLWIAFGQFVALLVPAALTGAAVVAAAHLDFEPVAV